MTNNFPKHLACTGDSFNFGTSASYVPYTAIGVSYPDLVKKSNVKKLFEKQNADYKETSQTITETEPFETQAPKPSKSFKLIRRSLFLLFILSMMYVICMLIINL